MGMSRGRYSMTEMQLVRQWRHWFAAAGNIPDRRLAGLAWV